MSDDLQARHIDQAGAQQELPFALVYGQAVTELPLDLYIPYTMYVRG